MRLLIRLAFALLLLFIVGQLSVQADGTSSSDTYVRFIHASPNAPAADVYIDGQRRFANITFGNNSNSSNYVPLAPGNHHVRILPAGSPSDTPQVTEGQFPFGENKYYSLVAFGKLEQLELIPLEDNNYPTPPGKTRISFVHASPESPNLDICFLGQATGGNTNCYINNLTYKTTGFMEVEAGVYTIDVRQAGTDGVLVPIQNAIFQDGYSYSYYIIGLVNGEPHIQETLIPYRTRVGSGDTTNSCLRQGCPPGRPPISGAFLAPELSAGIVATLFVLGTSFWAVRRRFWD